MMRIGLLGCGNIAGIIASRGKDVVVLSVGALVESSFLGSARKMAAANGCRIHVPSGAIFVLDNLKVTRVSRGARIGLERMLEQS